MNNRNRFVVPWKNPAEFLKVYEHVYSDDLLKNRLAVEQMAVWETRCWPSLPISVEATLLLLRCKIQDKLYEASKSLCDAQETEMMYSTAVVRFVNLIIEQDQNSVRKHSVSFLAAQRNIPSWIVDVRHGISHGLNPTLPVLRMAHGLIMEYLEETYWLPESSRITPLKKTYDDQPMIDLLQAYRDARYKSLSDVFDPEKPSKTPLGNVMKKIDTILNKPESRRRFIQVLVHPDHFVTKDDINILVGDDAIFFEEAVKPELTAPVALRKFWYPMIQLLHKHDLVSTFLELLLLSQEKRTKRIYQKAADAIVVFVMELANPASDKCTLEPDNLFVRKGANLNYYRMLYSCVRGCSTSSATVFSKLAGTLNMKSWVEELSAMLNMRQGKTLALTNNVKKKREIDITFTADDLEEDIRETLRKSKKQKVVKNVWSLAPLSLDLSKVPIGHVFNPVDITKKEEMKQETESNSNEEVENIYFTSVEESMPVEKQRPKHFIFKTRPNLSSMLYGRTNRSM